MSDEAVPGGAPGQDQLSEEAAIWFARMRGPDAETYRPQFETWLGRGAAQRGAYNRAGEVFALGKFLTETPDHATIDARNRVDPWISPRVAALAATLALVLGVGAWFGRDMISGHQPRPELAGTPGQVAPDFERVEAASGARREVVLADGSKVTLEPGSVLGTRLGKDRRELRLERGRARFEVAHETRPFIVFAGGGSVTARGTIFDVILDAGNEVTVRLLRGAVDVARPERIAPAGSAPAIVTRLAPGETLRFGAPATSGTDLAAAASTPSLSLPIGSGDVLEFEKVPLSQVLAQANQASGTAIRVSDPAIGRLQVSGRFRIDDPDQVAERLAALLNLKVERSGKGEIVLAAH